MKKLFWAGLCLGLSSLASGCRYGQPWGWPYDYGYAPYGPYPPAVYGPNGQPCVPSTYGPTTGQQAAPPLQSTTTPAPTTVPSPTGASVRAPEIFGQPRPR